VPRAGVVDQYVEPAVVGEDTLDRRADGRGIGDVERADVQVDAGFAQAVGAGGIPQRGDGPEARARRADRGGEADPGGCPRDQDDALGAPGGPRCDSGE
jgi:hypothetical protein